MTHNYPLIGITAGEVFNRDHPWSPVVYGQSYTYVEVIARAGGVPVILPLLKDEAELAKLYDRLDGVLFAGGNDIDPRLYGEEPGDKLEELSPLRDSVESALIKKTLQDNKPLLGICRGMELLNIVRGGNLYQDVHTVIPNVLDHDASTKLQTLDDTSHELRLKPGSALAGILGPEHIGTNAHHHQAIKQLGQGLEAVAWTSDEVIEAIELPGAPFALGVQSHPESLAGSAEPRWQRMFDAFVQAASRQVHGGRSG